MLDDRWRKPVAAVGDFGHRASLPSASLPNYPVKLTQPPRFLPRTGSAAPSAAGWRRTALSQCGVLAAKLAAGDGGIMPERAILVRVWRHRRCEALPVIGIQIVELANLERRIAVAVTQYGLHLKQRVASVESDRRVGSGQPDVGKERPEPLAGFDDALETLVVRGSRNVDESAREEGPARCGPRKIAAPDLNDTGLSRRGQEGRAKRFQALGGQGRKMRAEAGKIDAVELGPLFGAAGVTEISDVSLQPQAKCHGGEEIPTEPRSARDRLAVSVG